MLPSDFYYRDTLGVVHHAVRCKNGTYKVSWTYMGGGYNHRSEEYIQDKLDNNGYTIVKVEND